MNLASSEDLKLLRSKESSLEEKRKRLIGLQKSKERSMKYRTSMKRRLEDAYKENPELRRKLKVHDNSGRPSAVEEQPELLKTIVDIALMGSGADERRCTQKIRTVKTLDQLTDELRHQGYNLSRSGVYLHLLPRKSKSTEGKRHVNCAPVKLVKSQNDQHAKHPDTNFAKASIRGIEEISSILGDSEVCFLSIDAKARVPIGITAANKQAPFLMHVEYKVKLPDHDFVKAPQHKLIPDVFAGIKINNTPELFGDSKAVSYSGPTYIAVRSAKHSISSANHHFNDIHHLLSLPEFSEIMLAMDGSAKPVRFITCDGGPDENPRYSKTIDAAIQSFLDDNLDVLVVATNAPGRSAFNRVERRMAPLSKELAGVILPHEHFGSHLNAELKTVDTELEKKNFEHAGKILSEIWSGILIDNYPVVCDFVSEERCDRQKTEVSSKWRDEHVMESQYCLQIVKCSDRQCCSPPRSSYFSLIDRFLPGPLPLTNRRGEGLQVELNNTQQSYLTLFQRLALKSDVLPPLARAYSVLPYDFACPTIHPLVSRRTCGDCSKYFATIKSLKIHKASHSFPKPTKRLQVQRIAARRQRELMCVIAYGDQEELEWHDEDDVDYNETDADIPSVNVVSGTPTIKIKSVNLSFYGDD